MSKTKVLNLYAGIGGNRKLWENVDVTAVEWDEEKAEVYRDNFPNDDVLVADAHGYLVDHYTEYDFIWTSPPCPTHSTMEMVNHSQHGARYPDMKLYQEIILLQTHAENNGVDYVVENVRSYYEPLIQPQAVARHYFWSNYHISDIDVELLPKRQSDMEGRGESFDLGKHESKLGYDLSAYDMTITKKKKCLANCVQPRLGKHVFESRTTQDTLPGVKP